MRIVAIGEILWDVFESGEHLGGAVFNFAAHCSQLGHDVTFISAVGEDGRGRRALETARSLGLSDRYIRTAAGVSTGYVTVTVDGLGQPAYVIHRPAAYDFAELTAMDLTALARSDPDWVCYGTLYQIAQRGRVLTGAVSESCPDARRFYDVNLRRDSYTPELVQSLLEASDVVKMNEDEMKDLGEMLGLAGGSVEDFCRCNAERFGWEAVCVTQGAAGSSVLAGGAFASVSGVTVKVADTVGAGDAYSAAFLHGLDAGWPPEEIASFANRSGALVASRDGAVPRWSVEDL